MKPAISKHSVAIGQQKTSVSLEEEFWTALKQIASEKRTTVARLVEEINASRANANLYSAIRVHVLKHYQQNESGFGDSVLEAGR